MKLQYLLNETTEKSEGHRTNIETDTIKNNNFRKVLFTTPRTQLVLMSLKPGEDIGEEKHKGDQFFRFEKGEGKMVINGKESKLTNGSSVVVPEGAMHNVINTGKEPLKLYALYSPPQHKDGTVDKIKPEKEDEAE